jgi:capsid protein
LDPFKEAQAAKLRINTGITTRAEEVVAYDGGDWELKHRQSVRETADRVEGGLQPPVGMESVSSPQPPANGQPDPEDPEDPEDLIDSLS